MNEPPKNQTQHFEMWGILELMGHRRLAGRIIEEEHFGTNLCRIDIPLGQDEYLTQYYSAAAIYCLTPSDEATARAVAAQNRPRPVNPMEIGSLLPNSQGPTLKEYWKDEGLDHDDDEW